MFENINFIEDITRINTPIIDVIIRYKGECEELEKWIDWNFSNHLLISNNKNVTLYCDKEECNEFYKILEKKLDNDLFNKLCLRYFELIEKAKETEGIELQKILIEIWPILTIFHEISLDPNFLSELELRRLTRVRKTTESLIYDLFKKLRKKEEPPNYFLFNRKIYPQKINLNSINIIK